MRKTYIPTRSPEDWKQFLIDPEKQWRTGYSAKALAYSWESANGFPSEVNQLFAQSRLPEFQNLEPILIFPEYPVMLPGGARPSQNDIFVLAKADGGLISMTVEGKVSEPFGPTLEKWLAGASAGKTQRLGFLKEKLGLACEIPMNIRYQLIHRAVSALLEAEKFNAPTAVMLIHSFNQDDLWFEEFVSFMKLFQVETQHNQLTWVKKLKGINFYSGWVRGNSKYLDV
jgi:hypothetical protein